MNHQNRSQLLLSLAVAAASLSAVETSAQALEEVVVTAQRQAQTLSDVPIAVTAFSAEGLKNFAVDDLSDLNLASPSFMATPFLSDPLGNAPVRIRGIGTGGGNPGFEGAVGLYVDDVYRSRTGSAMLTFFDMAGVEILRGPQGTLFGKNTTAGALLMKTAAPDFDDTYGSITAEGGNYGQSMVEAMYNVPLSDTMAFRVAAIKDEQDGWFQHPKTGQDTFWTDNKGIRASLAYKPNDALSARLTIDAGSMTSPGNYGTSTRLNNSNTDGNDAAQVGLALFSLNLIPGVPGGEGYWYWDPNTGEGVDPYSRDIANSNIGSYRLEQDGITLRVDADLNDNWSLTSITGQRSIDSLSDEGDWDFGPIALAGGLDQRYEFDTFSQEFIINGSLGDDLSITAGLNYFTEDIVYERRASVGVQFAPFYFGALGAAFGPAFAAVEGLTGVSAPGGIANFGVPNLDFQDLEFDQTEDSLGVFAQASFDVNDQITLIGGLRWNQIEKDIVTDNLAADTHAEYHDLVLNTAGFFYMVGAALSSPDWERDYDDDEWTYTLTGQYRPTDDMMIYATYSRGFKAGGFNMTENAAGKTPGGVAVGTGTPDPALGLRFFTPEANPVFGAEYVDAYELGMKWTVSDNARLNATVFRAEYDDLQVSAFTGLVFEVTNAGSSTTQGLELELDWALSETWALTGGFSYIDATYGSNVNGFPAGRQRGQTPEEALALGLRYNKPMANGGEIYANANVSYNGEMYLAEGTDDFLSTLQQDGYTVFSATVGLRPTENFDLALFCNNCFDEDYYEWAFNQPFQNAIAVNPAPPRTFGARVTLNF